jgi:hypothetical protein
MLQRIGMLTAVVAVIFIDAIIHVGFCTEAGALSRKGPILQVEHPGGDTFVSQRYCCCSSSRCFSNNGDNNLNKLGKITKTFG